MTVELARTHPLEAVTDPATTHPPRAARGAAEPRRIKGSDAFAGLPDSVGITVEPFVAMADVRLGEAAERLDLPTVPNTWVPTDTGRAVWLGPDEWLLTSTTETPQELEARVRAAVVPLGGSATDVSAQRITLRLSGRRVRDVLAKGCAIDLHPRVFDRGRCVQTTLGLAGVVLLALSDAESDGRHPGAVRSSLAALPSASGDDYLVLVRSSFAGYLADWLLDAALEFTGQP